MSEKQKSVDPETRELRSTSVSAVAKFDPEQDGGCNARWYGRYVLGWPEPQKETQNKGTQVHARCEHWGKTGEDVLGPIERAGIHLLLPPGEGLKVEWGLNDRPRPPDIDGKQVNHFPPEESLLRADGLPFIGFADRINERGEYIDPEGNLIKEPGVVEIEDLKTSGNARQWAKSAEQLLKTTQMTGYAAWAVAKYPNAEGIRLSHTTFDTKVRFAKKSTVRISVEKATELWQKHGVDRVRAMREVARLRNFDDVPKNTAACSQFGGCPFISRCFKTTADRLRAKKGLTMGLLDKAKKAAGITGSAPPPNGAPPAAAQTPAPPPAATTAAPPAAAAPPPTPAGAPAWAGSIEISKCEMDAEYVIDAAGTLAKFVGGSRGFAFFESSKGLVKLDANNGKVDPKPAPPPPAPKAEAKPKAKTKTKDDTQTASGVVLFLNCAPNCAYTPLDQYITEVTSLLAEEYAVEDVRLPPDNDHPLAFNKWKPALALAVKKTPPAPGYYVTHGYGEIANEVVSALLPLCSMVVR